MTEKERKTVDVLKNDNAALIKENVSLKCKLSGYRTSNDNYRSQIEKLKERVEHYKSLDIEGDELYEKKIAECENLTSQLDNANLTIDELRGQIASYNNQILDYKDRIEGLKGEVENLHEIIKYEKTPWWKKLL